MTDRILQNFIAERETGEVLPISIGSALAVEAACGVNPELPRPPKAPIHDYDSLWVNVRTLHRNLHNSVSTTMRDQLLAKHIFELLVEEMMLIESMISQYTMGRAKVVFYTCTYRAIPRRFPRAYLWTPNTELQKAHKAIEEQVVRMVRKDDELITQDLREFDLKVDGDGAKSLLVTHYPLDLLSQYEFKTLTLLESHTGAIKRPPQWNTKLNNGDELHRIPFNRMTVQVFGDGNNHFRMMPRNLREAVIDLAEQQNWTTVTTKAKINNDLRKLKDPYARDFLKGLW